jgi:hypothetical protein
LLRQERILLEAECVIGTFFLLCLVPPPHGPVGIDHTFDPEPKQGRVVASVVVAASGIGNALGPRNIGLAWNLQPFMPGAAARKSSAGLRIPARPLPELLLREFVLEHDYAGIDWSAQCSG